MDQNSGSKRKTMKQAFFEKARYTLKQMWKYKISYVFLVPFLAIFVTFTILPVITAVSYSFTQFNILESPIFIGFENYRNLFLKDAIFLVAIKNTLLFAAITGPISYLTCLLLAWFVNDLMPKTRSLLTLLFYAPSLANIFFIWQLIFSGDAMGLLNAWLMKIGLIYEPILWLTDTKRMVPVTLFIILWSSIGTSFLAFIAGFQTVDESLYEAGAVDGVKNRWQELWFITLPYMRPQLMFGAVMSITGSFGIGATITALVGYPSTNYVLHTIMNHLDDYGGLRFEMGYACAIATILFTIMVGVNKGVQKILVKVGS